MLRAKTIAQGSPVSSQVCAWESNSGAYACAAGSLLTEHLPNPKDTILKDLPPGLHVTPLQKESLRSTALSSVGLTAFKT